MWTTIHDSWYRCSEVPVWFRASQVVSIAVRVSGRGFVVNVTLVDGSDYDMTYHPDQDEAEEAMDKWVKSLCGEREP